MPLDKFSDLSDRKFITIEIIRRCSRHYNWITTEMLQFDQGLSSVIDSSDATSRMRSTNRE